MSNVLVIFQADTEATEQLALAAGVGAVSGVLIGGEHTVAAAGCDWCGGGWTQRVWEAAGCGPALGQHDCCGVGVAQTESGGVGGVALASQWG